MNNINSFVGFSRQKGHKALVFTDHSLYTAFVGGQMLMIIFDFFAK
jgi:hypothetical protein